MRKRIIHPTHRKFLCLLRKRYKEGTPVVVLKNEIEIIFETLPSIQTPTARNQYIYREALRAMNRPLSEIQECTDVVVFGEKIIDLIESLYAQVERKHLCATVIDSVELFRRRRGLRRK